MAIDPAAKRERAKRLANDYSVNKFLNNEIIFTDIFNINESVMDNHPWIQNPRLDDLHDLNMWVKDYVTKF